MLHDREGARRGRKEKREEKERIRVSRSDLVRHLISWGDDLDNFVLMVD